MGTEFGSPRRSHPSLSEGQALRLGKGELHRDRLLIGTRDLSNRIYDFDGPDGPFNDEISSLKLRKPGTAILYADTDGGAGRRCFGLDGEDRKVPDLASLDWQFDNVASSSKIPKSTHPNACDAA